MFFFGGRPGMDPLSSEMEHGIYHTLGVSCTVFFDVEERYMDVEPKIGVFTPQNGW